jgi:hypothetical protein
MKPNLAFDEITLRWWNLTSRRVRELALRAWQFRNVTTGNQRDVVAWARGDLRRLATTRREVFRAGSAV